MIEARPSFLVDWGTGEVITPDKLVERLGEPLVKEDEQEVRLEAFDLYKRGIPGEPLNHWQLAKLKVSIRKWAETP